MLGRVLWALSVVACASPPPAAAPAKTPAPEESVRFCAKVLVERDVPRCLGELTPEQQRRRARSVRLEYRGQQVLRQDVVSGSGAPLPDEASLLFEHRAKRVVGWSLENRNAVSRGRDEVSQDGNWVRWLDEQGRPRARSKTHVSGVRRQLDAQGRVVAFSWVDAQGSPAADGAVAEVRDSYDARGFVVQRSYFGARGEPGEDAEGVHRVVSVTDARGNEVERRSFDAQGRPRRTVRTTYDAYGNALTEVEGAVTVRYARDERGNELSRELLDEAGRPRVGPGGWATRRQRYDEQDLVVETSYFGVSGEPVREETTGAASIRYERSERGNVLREQLLDEQGAATSGVEGYHSVEVEYDARDNPVSYTYSLPSGEPAPLAARRRYYDGDRLIREEYLNAAGEPMLTPLGYAAYEQAYEDDGSEGVKRLFDAEGGQRVTCHGSAPLALQNELAERAGSLGACYERLLRYGATAEGRLMVELSIDGRGQVLNVKLVEDQLGDGDLARCALATMRVPFLNRAEGDCATVRVPVAFRQKR